MPKFSIITPCYNSFSIMNRYFDSFNNQTYKNFEVIIVDDCSTDFSFNSICEEKKHTLFDLKIYKTQSNSGPGIARNLGIEKSSGEWIVFVDSDDYVSNDFIETLNSYCTNSIDALFFDYYIVKNRKINKQKLINRTNYGFIDKYNSIVGVKSCACACVFKKSILSLNNIRFSKLKRYEDFAFKISYMSVSSNFLYIKKPIYYYVINLNSVTHLDKNVLYYCNESLKIIEPFFLDNSDLYEALFLKEYFYLFIKNHIFDKSFREMSNKLLKKYPLWGRNKYRKFFSFNQKLILFLYKINLLLLIKIIIKLRG